MDSRTYSKNLRISPKKLRFILPEIKKLTPADALVQLFYSSNHPSKIFYTSIKSAITNAINVLKVDERVLRFKHLSVEEGQKLKRFRAGGRGTAKPIMKRYAHIKIILNAEEQKINPTVSAKSLPAKVGDQKPAKADLINPKTKTKIKFKESKSKVKVSTIRK